MSNNHFNFNFDEFRRELRALPAELRNQAAREVQAAGNAAAVDIRTAYGKHRVTGHLQESVDVVEQNSGQFGISVQVISKDKVAHFIENGTQARHNMNGANRGRMPPMHIFIPRMIKHRRAMYQRIRGIMERAGLVVTET